MYKASAPKVEEAFSKISAEVFDGLLDLSDIDILDISDMDTEYGFCFEEDRKIIFGIRTFFPNKTEFRETICHEMVHLYQILNGYKVDHGSNFSKFVTHARKFGYEISNSS